jgi:diguanylate cyclase (GGDEF)-like protein/PAS domain S-box-containing protein
MEWVQNDEWKLLAAAMAALPQGIIITEATAKPHSIVYVNPAFTRITGYTAEAAIGRGAGFLVAEDMHQPGLEAIRSALRAGAPAMAVVRSYHQDGHSFWNELHVMPVKVDGGRVTHTLSLIQDVSARVLEEQKLGSLATHDPLTGLANQILLNDRVRQAINHAERDQKLIAVLQIDLDRFKHINEALGHRAGDILLQAVAGRMTECVRDSDTVARVGGDEFVVLLTGIEQEDHLHSIGNKLREALAAPFHCNGQELRITSSIGASLYPRDAQDAETLLRLADLAMYQVKDGGRDDFRCFSRELAQRVTALSALETDLRGALSRQELRLYYQPKADLYSGAMTGVEALIRWQHPTRGLVAPGDFIPLAENSGMIVAIGQWVLHEACRQARAWQQEGFPVMRVAVNLSARQFRQPDLYEQVVHALTVNTLDAAWLELELTESMVMSHAESAIALLRRFKQLGVKLSMDDFGTGYSSLGHLRQFPFDTLKIDRSFVQDIVTEPDDALIAQAIIAMAHSLRLNVIAEGVETAGQMQYLRAHLCDEIQGYLFSKPLPAAEATEFMRRAPLLDGAGRHPAVALRTLLLVDDEIEILNALRRQLRRGGYRILTAESGMAALELLALNKVQVILSDQRMPGMTGAELLSRVKLLYPDTVRMVLSGYTELSALTDAINQGAIYKFITKPWDDSDLCALIHEAFVMHDGLAQQGAHSQHGREEISV